MSNNWFTRLTRIISDTFGSAKEDGLLESGLNVFERFVHFWVLVWRSFVRNRCPVRASALSYTTLLALIPMLAVAMSVASFVLKSEGEVRIRQFIESFVDNIVPNAPPKPLSPPVSAQADVILTNNLVETAFNSSNFVAAYYDGTNLDNSIHASPAAAVAKANAAQVKQDLSKQAAEAIYDFAHKSYSKTLGLTGVIFLFLTAILTLTRVEETFNDIWGVTRGREWASRITNYFFTVVVGPFLLLGAIGIANSPNFQKTRDVIGFVPFVEPLLTTYLPLMIICFTLAMIYKLVPNTKVDFGAAFVGGSLAGISWHFYNKIAVFIASRALSGGGASTVYGSLAMIPLIMGGLYVVWLTVLFGAQVAYAFQNRASYLQDKLAENVNQRGREFVALRLMTCIGQRFQRGERPVTIRQISTELGIPSKLVQQVLQTLLAANLVVEITGTETGYSPARPLDTINCHHVLLAMRATHGGEPATRDEPVRAEVLGEFARIQAVERDAATSVTLLALVNRAHARLELAAAHDPRQAVAEVSSVVAETKTLSTTVTATLIPTIEAEAIVTTDDATLEVNFLHTTDGVETTTDAPRKTPPQNISSSSPVASGIHPNESFPL